MIGKLTSVLIVVLIILLVLLWLGIMFFLYVKFFKKKTASVDEYDIDYSGLEKGDTRAVVGCEDIVDDMIVMDKGKRFVGVISCKGFDFYSANFSEQVAAKNGYHAFISTINEPITYRQSYKSVDMEYTENKYEAALAEREKELFIATNEYENLLDTLDKLRGKSEEEIVLSELERLQKVIRSLEWRVRHINDQLRFIRETGGGALPEPVETYVFDWTYVEGLGDERTKEEIYEMAKKELAVKASSMLMVLSNAGVRGYRLNTMELIGMVRRHFHPLSADVFRERDIENSSFFDDISSETNIDEMDREYEAFKDLQMMEQAKNIESFNGVEDIEDLEIGGV